MPLRQAKPRAQLHKKSGLHVTITRRVVSGFSDLRVRKVLEQVVDMTHLRGEIHVSVFWIGDFEMQALNKRTRGVNKTTDVLSFPFEQTEHWPGSMKELGEICISIPEAKRECKKEGREFGDEISLLLVHGFLHLEGYDHMEDEDRKRMFPLQNTILRSLGARASVMLSS